MAVLTAPAEENPQLIAPPPPAPAVQPKLTPAPQPDANPEPLLVVILGPTASGKTALALALAERFNGEIVSCDSVAVYRGMDLGTAKPTPAERARVPHHLIDIAAPDEPCTAGDYARLARAEVREIASRGRLPIVSGGTGLYLRALLDGLSPLPGRDEQLRERLRRSARRFGPAWLARLLLRLRSGAAIRTHGAAASIHENDEPKLIRAIEIALRRDRDEERDRPRGLPEREPLTGFRILRVGLDPDRAALYARINARAAAIFAAGLVDETRALMERYGPCPALDALGYRQAAAVLRGELSETEAIAAAAQGHRNYAKRQMTWFRREPDVAWLHGFGSDAVVVADAVSLVQTALAADKTSPSGVSAGSSEATTTERLPRASP